eukprot:SAG31_NODE_191_length_20809_cov_64.613761_14_plen_157_part_00
MELEKLYAKYKPVADFVTIYISEAHASDEWTLRSTANQELEGKWDVPVAKTLGAKLNLAKDWVSWLKPAMEYYVDLLGTSTETAQICCSFELLLVPTAVVADDNLRKAYGAWPERLVVVEGGYVKYYGDQGPWGYKVEEVADWLAQRFPADEHGKL